jgi:hypothetical protein
MSNWNLSYIFEEGIWHLTLEIPPLRAIYLWHEEDEPGYNGEPIFI